MSIFFIFLINSLKIKIAELELNGRETRLVRLYNPWGNEVEWNGEW